MFICRELQTTYQVEQHLEEIEQRYPRTRGYYFTWDVKPMVYAEHAYQYIVTVEIKRTGYQIVYKDPKNAEECAAWIGF